MDRIAEWRPVDPAGPDGPAGSRPDEEPERTESKPKQGEASWKLFAPALALVTIAGLAIASAIGVVVVSSLPKPAVAIDSATDQVGGQVPGLKTPSPSAAAGNIVVDVEGAVENPGVWSMPAGSRLGDAIAAAGGYSAQVDIDAASRVLNLAEPVKDGQQIHVPVLGAVGTPLAVMTSPGGGPSAGGSGLIDINRADEAALDSLPGIGPVTAGKIIAARTEAPFTSVDDLLARDVVGQSVFDKIKALVTVGP